MVDLFGQHLMRSAYFKLLQQSALRHACFGAALFAVTWLNGSSLSLGQVTSTHFVLPAPILPLGYEAPTDQTVPVANTMEQNVFNSDEGSVASAYSPDEIAKLASKNASLAVLMRGDLRADQASVGQPSKNEKVIFDLRRKLQEYRICRQSQLAAAQALELHFGLATLAALEPIQAELNRTLTISRERQIRAMEQGLSILDPTAIERLMASAKDTQLQSQLKDRQLRSQLAILVTPSIACSYSPQPMNAPDSSMVDHCCMIDTAMCQRCDLIGLVYLRSQLNEDTLDVARWMSDSLSGTIPLATKNALRPLSLLGIVSSKEKKARHEELCARRSMLDQAIISLKAKIASEVDIAIYKQSTAIDRYTNTQIQIQLWTTRLAQLRLYGDQVKSQIAEELEAQMQLLQVQSELIQRQGDWHQAVVELALAIGCVP